MKELTPAERVIVAADFKPELGEGPSWVRRMVLSLADQLAGLGVYLKVNSALRACGYELIREIHDRGLLTCADLKLIDIKETLSIDGAFLGQYRPGIVTVMAAAGKDSLVALKEMLPTSEVIAVTVPTHFTELDAKHIYDCSIEEGVRRLAYVTLKSAKLDGLVCAPTEATILREVFGDKFSINAAGIRPTWHLVVGDDQNPKRIMTPSKAMATGVTRLIIGRPITGSSSPRRSVVMTIEELTLGLESREVKVN